MKIKIGKTLAAGFRMALFLFRFVEHLKKGPALEHFNEHQITVGWDSCSHAFRAGGKKAARLLGGLLSADSCKDGFFIYDAQCLVIFPPDADSAAIKQWLISGITDAGFESGEAEGGEGEGHGSAAEEEEEEEEVEDSSEGLDNFSVDLSLFPANPFSGFNNSYAMESLDHAKRQRTSGEFGD